MMNSRFLASTILLIFTIVAVFGLYLMLALPVTHGSGCPFAFGETALCATTLLAHISHWQKALAALTVEVLIFLALTSLPLPLFRPPNLYFEKFPKQKQRLNQPTLLQLLFSQGLLNPKKP